MTKAEYIERYGLERYEQHKAQVRIHQKTRYHNDPEYRESHNAQCNARSKERYHNDPEYRKAHNVWNQAYIKARYQNDPEFRESENTRCKDRYKNELNSAGRPKHNIRRQSQRILFDKRHHSRIKGYEIHHAFGYEDPGKFIYVPKTLHNKIHQFLRDNNIDADSNHFSSIAQLINECSEYTYVSA